MFLKVVLVTIGVILISHLALMKFLKIKRNPFKRYEYFNGKNKKLISKLQKAYFIITLAIAIPAIIVDLSYARFIVPMCILVFSAVYSVIIGLDQLEAEPDKKVFIISFVDSGICIGLVVMLIIEIIR
jgi:hypothetical protein